MRVVDLRDQHLVPWFVDERVKVRRPVRVAILCLEEPPNDSISRNGVANHFHGAEPETTVFVGRELATEVHLRLLGILVLVQAHGGGMPDVDFGANDGVSGSILDTGIDEKRVTRRVGTDDCPAVWNGWRV